MYVSIIFALQWHLANVILKKNQVVYVHIVLTLSFSHVFPFHVIAPGTEKEVGEDTLCISVSSSTNGHCVQEDA